MAHCRPEAYGEVRQGPDGDRCGLRSGEDVSGETPGAVGSLAPSAGQAGVVADQVTGQLVGFDGGQQAAVDKVLAETLLAGALVMEQGLDLQRGQSRPSSTARRPKRPMVPR